MRHLQDTLAEVHHLKHGGRLQYGLFLKVVHNQLLLLQRFHRSCLGYWPVPSRIDDFLEDGVSESYGSRQGIWNWLTLRLCLTEILQFDKEYSYNVRHSYGQEGRRKSYDSYNCIKIVTTSHPQAGDAHGLRTFCIIIIVLRLN